MKPFSNHRQHEEDPGGYLTVFLSLCLPVILSLFFTLMEGAQMNAARMQIEIAAGTALDSVMAEYHRELLRQYDLLMIDVSYGTTAASTGQLEEHLKGYMENNFCPAGGLTGRSSDFTNLSLNSMSVSGTRFAADNGCAALREQVTAYMTGEPVEAMVSQVLEQMEEYNSYGFDLSAWSERMDRYGKKMRSIKTASSRQQESGGSESEEETAAENEEEKVKKEAAETFAEEQGVTAGQMENPAEEITSSSNRPLLRQVLGEQMTEVSRASVNTASLLSGRTVHYGDGAEAENSHGYDAAGKVLFDLYAFEKCGNYRNPMEKSALKYQIEYLLSGKSSDEENLNETVKKIMMIRLAANMAFLAADNAKREEIRTWAAAAAAIAAVPALEPVVGIVLMLAWSYVESLQDLKTLMAGGKIPVMKTGSQWKTDIKGIFKPEEATSAESGGRGLDYEDYLHILLFLHDEEEKSLRLMDMMEADIRRTEGNGQFRMDWCLDTFSMEASCTDSSGRNYSISRQVTFN